MNVSSLRVSDGILKFTNVRTTMPISLKYLETCLKDIIKNPDQVDKIMNYIKDKREVKNSVEIKRFYNN